MAILVLVYYSFGPLALAPAGDQRPKVIKWILERYPMSISAFFLMTVSSSLELLRTTICLLNDINEFVVQMCK